jgi:hypothetical protein
MTSDQRGSSSLALGCKQPVLDEKTVNAMKLATTQFDLLFCVAFATPRMCCLASKAHGVIHQRIVPVKCILASEKPERTCTSGHCFSKYGRLRRSSSVVSYTNGDASMSGPLSCNDFESTRCQSKISRHLISHRWTDHSVLLR